MYQIFHNIDGEKTTTLKTDGDLIDFMNRIRIENEDYDFSIIGVSDALEYLEDFCHNLTLLGDFMCINCGGGFTNEDGDDFCNSCK
jgi:hypothetical protein